MRRFLLLFSFLSLGVMAQEGHWLIDPQQHNGSFEAAEARPPYRPWVLSAREQREGSIEVRDGSEAIPAPDGDRYLVLRSTNEDQKGNTVGVVFRKLPLPEGLVPGQRFRLSWQARSRKPSDYNAVFANLSFRKEGEARPLLHRRMPYKTLKSTEWTRFEFDVLYPTEDQPDSIEVGVFLTKRTLNNAVQEMEGYVDDIRLEQLPGEAPQAAVPTSVLNVVSEVPPPIPVPFTLEKAGLVTLVIEDQEGRRVRNLVSAVPYEAGSQLAYWDGMDEGVPVAVPGAPAAQAIRRSPVPEGRYRVRGIVRDPLKLTYEMTAYPNTGNPPWITERLNGAGGWLADHGVPTACAYIPKGPRGKEEVLIASPVAESGQALAWVDLDGTKVGGRFRLGGHWTGATHLARDRGERTHPEIYLYTLQRWSEIRMMGLTASGALTAGMIEVGENKPGGDTDQVTGLAVHNGRLVYSTTNPDRLHFYDTLAISPAERATRVGEHDLPAPQAVAFDQQGRLLVLSEGKLLRYPSASLPLGKPEVLIQSGLQEPRAITLDEEDRIYIADWGDRHQILVFSPEGKPLRTIGKPGKPASGPYDEAKLNFPYGMTIDSRGQLWVAGYRWRTPKTVSVWEAATGKHQRSYYGPSEYGGGGNLDPSDSNRFLYANAGGGVEFQVDWEQGKASPRSIYWLASETPATQPRWKGPDYPKRIGEHRYITSEFGGLPTQGGALAVWLDRSPQGAKPLFAVSSGHRWVKELEELGFLDRFEAFKKGGRDRHAFLSSLLILWLDLNGDGALQEEELSFREFPREEVGMLLGANFGQGHEVLVTHRLGVISLKPRSIRDDGLPLYDLDDAVSAIGEARAPQASAHASGGGQALRAPDGTVIVTGGPMMGFRDGQRIWSYHSQWPGLHAGHAAPKAPEYPGQLLATTRLLGPIIEPPGGEGGPMWAVNSDKGLAYLLTTDGLFVDTLFEYPGEAQHWNVPKARRGMDVTRFNMSGETFWPTINNTPEGGVMLVGGKMHSSFIQLHGLEGVRRFNAPELSVGPDELKAVEQYQLETSRQQAGETQAIIPLLEAAPTLEAWTGGPWLPLMRGQIKRRFSARDAVWSAASLAVDRQHLYIAVRTREQRGLLQNAGEDLQTFFSSGGGLDLQLATRAGDLQRREPAQGDVRLIVAENGGKPKAVLYRPVVPGTKEPVRYESPVGETRIDEIQEVTDRVQLASRKQTLSAQEAGAMGEGEFREYLVTVPLSLLGWDPQKLPVTRGDIGVLIGRSGATVDRSYWHNQNAGLVNDLPGEARLTPAHWGEWRVGGQE